jgi:hypothetical protein
MLPPSSGWKNKPTRNQREVISNHGVIFQKAELFITTAVRTSNPTNSIYRLYCRPKPIGM